jgi:transcriptional regulator with XRE-family HTH domain
MKANTGLDRIERITTLRDEGLTQVQIAKEVGCSQAYVSQVLSGRHSGIAQAAREAHEAAAEAADAEEHARYQIQRAEERERIRAAPDTAAKKVLLRDRVWRAKLDFYHQVRAAGDDFDLREAVATRIEDEEPAHRSLQAILADMEVIRQDIGDRRTHAHAHAMIMLINEVELLPYGAFPDEVSPAQILPKRPKWMPDVREPLTAAGQTELHLLHAMGRNRAALKEFWQRASTVNLTPRRIAHMYDELITLEYAAKQAKVEHAQAQLDAFTTSTNQLLFA